MFKKLLKWFTQLFSESKEPEGIEPLHFDINRKPDIEKEYALQGFDDYWRMRFFDVCHSYTQESNEIKYVHQQIKETFKSLELGVDYQYELVITDSIPKDQYKRYFNDVEIKKKYYIGKHVYLYLGFNKKLIEEKYGNDDYWWDRVSIDRNLDKGFRGRYYLMTWMKQNRPLTIADRQHIFKFEIDFNDFNKTLYFNQDLHRSYLKELKELIIKDIEMINELEYSSVELKFKSTTMIDIEITCDKWGVRDIIDEMDNRLMDMIIHNMKSLYTDKYFYRNLLEES